MADRGYLVHAWTHRGQIRLAGRLENGESFAAIFPPRDSRQFEPDPAGAWESFEGEGLRMVGEGSGPRSDTASRRDTGLAPAEEFLLFHSIRGTLTLRGENRPGRRVSRVFTDPEIAPSDHRPEVVWAALDIETDRSDTVTAISLVCGDREVVFYRNDIAGPATGGATRGGSAGGGTPHGRVTSANPPPPIRVFPTEPEVLAAFAATVREWDPDIITGWNVVAFDFAVLARRFEATGVPFDLGRAEDEPARVRNASARPGWVTVPGRQVVDGMRIVRGSGRTFTDMSLDTVAHEVLQRGKTVSRTGEEKIAELERLRREDPVAFCRYCLEDSRLVPAILAETGLDELTVIRANLTGLSFDLAWTSIPAFERIYALELIRRRILPPRGRREGEVSGAAGGTVLEATPGLFRNVLVFDFRSLYPSVILTFNIDPLGYARALQAGGDQTAGAQAGGAQTAGGGQAGHAQPSIVAPNGAQAGGAQPSIVAPNGAQAGGAQPSIVAPNGARFSREPAILPALIDTYFQARQDALDAGDPVAGFVYKILMNSFYGVLGSSGCIYGRTELAGAITGFGRFCLLFARDFFRDRGMTVLYGDTDSVFVYADGKNLSGRGESIAEELNEQLAKRIRDDHHVESRIRIRCDSVYQRFLLPRLRSVSAADGGAIRGRAKGYAGLPAGDSESADAVEIKGMEAARSDYTPLARRFQRELLDLLFHDAEPGDVEGYVRRQVEELLEGRLDHELVYTKILRRPAHEYRHSATPQVRAARKLGWTTRRGRIAYVMTSAGPEPVALPREGELDYRHYIEHQLRPIWLSLAEAADLGASRVGQGERERDAALTGKAPRREAGRYSSLRPLDDQLELGF